MAVTWQTTTLPQGLRVVTTPVPTTQATTVNLFVGVGSRSEPQRLNGITHFLEHMIFKGTERRPRANMIAEEIEGAGGTLNAYTNKEFTCYWNIVPFDRLETAIDITADMLLHSTLSQEEIDRERTVVQQELKRSHDNPGAWVSRLLGLSVYGEQPCGWDVGGSVELVDEMNRPDFIEHMEGWYRGPNMVLSVAGNCTHEQVLELAAPRFADVAAGGLPDVTPYDPATSGARISIDSRDIDQCSVMLGLPLFGRDDPRRFALRILNGILGSGMSSRLFTEVRERRGLAYSISSGYGYLADAGVFTVSAGVNREKLTETIGVCLDELQKLIDEPVPEDELRRAKDHAIGRFRLSLETAFSLGQRHGEQLLTKGKVETIDDFVAGLEAVDASQVRAVATDIFVNDLLHCAAVGPDLSEDEISNAISR